MGDLTKTCWLCSKETEPDGPDDLPFLHKACAKKAWLEPSEPRHWVVSPELLERYMRLVNDDDED